MKYLEGVDYWVRLVEFPNMASPSVAVSNGDGTFTIYVNSRFSPEKRAEGLRHELEHLEGEHFYRDDVELAELEAAADRLITLAPPERVEETASGRAAHTLLPRLGTIPGGFSAPGVAGEPRAPAPGRMAASGG